MIDSRIEAKKYSIIPILSAFRILYFILSEINLDIIQGANLYYVADYVCIKLGIEK